METEFPGNVGQNTARDVRSNLQALLTGVPEEFEAPQQGTKEFEIFQAARSVFAAKGFDGTRTRDIAEEASVNVAMIHYYFRNKQSLYFRVLSTEIRGLFLKLAEVWSTVDSIDDIALLLPVKLMTIFNTNQTAAKLMRREIGSGGLLLSKVIEQMDSFGPRGFKKLLRASFSTGQEKSRFKNIPFEHFAAYLLSLSYGMVFFLPIIEKMLDEDFSEKANWEPFMKVVAELLESGICSQEVKNV